MSAYVGFHFIFAVLLHAASAFRTGVLDLRDMFVFHMSYNNTSIQGRDATNQTIPDSS